jgi:hypothetical protein
VNQRPLLGAMRPATRGIAAWDEDLMEVVLWRVFETPVVEVCPEQGALQFDEGGNSPLFALLAGHS